MFAAFWAAGETVELRRFFLFRYLSTDFFLLAFVAGSKFRGSVLRRPGLKADYIRAMHRKLSKLEVYSNCGPEMHPPFPPI